MSIRVYQYGLLQPTKNADKVREELWLAHRYYNMLIEIERNKRACFAAAYAEFSEIAALEAQIAAVEARLEAARTAINASRAETRTRAASPLAADAKTALAELKTLRQSRKAAKLARKEQLAPVFAAIQAKATELVKHYRATAAPYWGTYLLVEQAVDLARKAPTEPKFRRWGGSGNIGVQIQGGMACAEVFSEKDSRLQIRPVPSYEGLSRGARKRASRTVLRMRIGSDGRAPIWAEWPMMLHRQLPLDGRIKDAKVLRQQLPGTWERWSVCITVETPDVVVPAGTLPRPGIIALDVGWRPKEDGSLRVASWVDHAGKLGELVVPARVLTGLSKAESIRSIRDKNQDEFRALFLEDLRPLNASGPAVAAARSPMPEVLRSRCIHVAKWRSPRRFYVLRTLWLANRFDGDDAAFKRLSAFTKRDLHLWRYEFGTRQHSTLHRREIFRIFARRTAEAYGTIVLEDFDLRAVAVRARPEQEVAGPNKGYNRVRAAVSVLRQELAKSAVKAGGRIVTVNPAYTTQDCSACHTRMIADFISTIEVKCQACGKVWDQDENAARNLLAAALLPPDPAAAPAEKAKRAVARFSKRHKAIEVTLEP